MRIFDPEAEPMTAEVRPNSGETESDCLAVLLMSLSSAHSRALESINETFRECSRAMIAACYGDETEVETETEIDIPYIESGSAGRQAGETAVNDGGHS